MADPDCALCSTVDKPPAAPETEEPGDQHHGKRTTFLSLPVVTVLTASAPSGHAKGQAELQFAVE